MNENKTYADAFTKAFLRESDFLSFLGSISDRAKWMRKQTKNLRIVAMTEGDPLTNALRKNYDAEGNGEIIDDTMIHTSLLLQTEDELIPIRSCAIKTILDRARINGYALYCDILTGKEKLPNLMSIQENSLYHWGDFVLRVGESEDIYLERKGASVNGRFIPHIFSFIDLDGEWHSEGDMCFFAMVNCKMKLDT